MRPRGLAFVLGFAASVSFVTACKVEPAGDDELGHASSSTTSTESTESTGESSSGESSSETDDCIPTALGCECGQDESCAPGLACVAGVCEFVGFECEPGTLECACLPDATCAEDWLTCEDGICDYTCTLGQAGCECLPTGCDEGLECIEGECWLPSAYPNCGWHDDANWFACGSAVVPPWIPSGCPEWVELVVGDPCISVSTAGCCDLDGNNWWCEGGVLAFDDCSDAP